MMFLSSLLFSGFDSHVEKSNVDIANNRRNNITYLPTKIRNNNNNINNNSRLSTNNSNTKVKAKNDVVKKRSYSLSANDKYLLEKIAMAEAESESTKTKAFVILTVLNRVKDDKFPDNVNDVIFQKKQFSPIDDGRWNRVEPNKDCKKALKLVINGSQKSKGCLYFESCTSTDNWHSRSLEFLFEIDGMRFYK